MNPGCKIDMFAFTVVLICILIGAIGQVSLKTGMKQLERIDSINDLISPNTILGIISNKFVVVGIFLYLFGSFLWLAGLSTLDLSFMYPMNSLIIVITTIAAFFILGENITILRWIGIASIVIGCILITKS